MPIAVCNDSCEYHHDGSCDDGGPGAEYTLCSRGTDCADCGMRGGGRFPEPPPPPPPADGILPDQRTLECPQWVAAGFCTGWRFARVVQVVCERSCAEWARTTGNQLVLSAA